MNFKLLSMCTYELYTVLKVHMIYINNFHCTSFHNFLVHCMNKIYKTAINERLILLLIFSQFVEAVGILLYAFL